MNAKPENVVLAAKAINHVLTRIQQDENLRYHMGALTQSFELLKQAHSALTGISEEDIDEKIFSFKLKRKPAALILDAVKDEVRNWQAKEFNADAAMVKIGGIVEVPF